MFPSHARPNQTASSSELLRNRLKFVLLQDVLKVIGFIFFVQDLSRISSSGSKFTSLVVDSGRVKTPSTTQAKPLKITAWEHCLAVPLGGMRISRSSSAWRLQRSVGAAFQSQGRKSTKVDRDTMQPVMFFASPGISFPSSHEFKRLRHGRRIIPLGRKSSP